MIRQQVSSKLTMADTQYLDILNRLMAMFPTILETLIIGWLNSLKIRQADCKRITPMQMVMVMVIRMTLSLTFHALLLPAILITTPIATMPTQAFIPMHLKIAVMA